MEVNGMTGLLLPFLSRDIFGLFRKHALESVAEETLFFSRSGYQNNVVGFQTLRFKLEQARIFTSQKHFL